MDPITLGIGAVGLGLSIFGGMSAADDAKQLAQQQTQLANQTYEINTKISGLEGQVNQQRKAQMELSGRRMQMENFRNVQRSRAMGLNASVNQGAQFGSGLQGGQAQEANQGLYNAQGINSNLEIGRNIFGLNDQISAQKMALSGVQNHFAGVMGSLQSQMATDQGIANIGGAVTKSAGMLGNMTTSVLGGSGPIGTFAGGGNNGAPPIWNK